MHRRAFVLASAAMLASPALGVELHNGEWNTLGWASAGRGEGPLVFLPSRRAPIWRLRLVLAGQGAMVRRLRVEFADESPPFRFDQVLFCTGQVVTRDFSLGGRRAIHRIVLEVMAPTDRRAVVRLFGRLG